MTTVEQALEDLALARDADQSTQDAPREPGKVEKRVTADMANMGGLDTGFRGSLAEIALALARALDRADTEEDIGKIAQVSLQLRQTLGSMADIGGDAESTKAIFEHMRTPVNECNQCGKRVIE